MSLRPEFVKLANRIAGVHRPLGFDWNGQPAQFYFSNEQLAPRGGWKLELIFGGHESCLELSRLPEFAWVSPTLAGIDLQGMPPELTCGLIEASFGEIFESLSKAGIDTRITAARPLHPDETTSEAIEWCINRGSETGWIRGRFSGSDAALEHLANLMQRAPVTPLLDDAALPMQVTLVAGTMPISMAELQQLEVDDVFLVNLSDFAIGSHCQLRAGKKIFGRGQLEKGTFTLTELTPHDTPMATNAPLNDLELELTFVVGQHTLTIGELRSLAPGFVFELPAGADEGVTIFANGKAIGKGELIDISDRKGVRVTAFATK